MKAFKKFVDKRSSGKGLFDYFLRESGVVSLILEAVIAQILILVTIIVTIVSAKKYFDELEAILKDLKDADVEA